MQRNCFSAQSKSRFLPLICIFAIIISLFAASLIPVYAETIGTAYNLGSDALRVRKSPGTGSVPVLDAIKEGDKVTVLDTVTGESIEGETTWYKIRTASGVVGYVSKTYLKVSDNTPDPPIVDDKDFEAYLTAQGFPDTYKVELRKLHANYPNWKFKAIHTGISWDDFIYREINPVSTSLVQMTSPDSWKSSDPRAIDPTTGKHRIFDSGGWVAASKQIVEHFADPRNSLDQKYIFQFLSNAYDESTQTSSTLSSVIGSSFLSGSSPVDNYSSYNALIMDAGRTYGVSPLTIASMIIHEQGFDGSGGCINGLIAGVRYYNFYNIGAYAAGGKSAVENGLIYAKDRDWDTRSKSILGGTQWFAKNYVQDNQYTLYFQRFNVLNGLDSVGTVQYATSIWMANSEGGSISSAYLSKPKLALTFALPVFKDMPSYACPLPGSGNNIKYLKSMSLSTGTLTPTFDPYKTYYEAVVPYSTSSVTIKATPLASDATITGAGSKSLSVGSNKFTVTCKSSGGEAVSYTVNISRQSAPVQPTTEVYPSSSKYILGDNLTGLHPGTSVSAFLSAFNKGTGSVKVYTSSGSEVTSGIVSTGMICKTIDSQGTVIKSMPIILKGDANGDGEVNIIDAVKILNHSVKKSMLSGAALKGADVNLDGDVNIIDAVIVLNHSVKKKLIEF